MQMSLRLEPGGNSQPDSFYKCVLLFDIVCVVQPELCPRCCDAIAAQLKLCNLTTIETTASGAVSSEHDPGAGFCKRSHHV